MDSLSMSFAPAAPRGGVTRASARKWASHWDCAPDEPIGDLPSDDGFIALLAAFRATGGIARARDLAGLLADRQRGALAGVARLLVSGAAFSFEWHDTFWVPMFQLDPAELSVRPGLRHVLAELATDFDGWRLAAWFARPHAALNGHRPVEVLDRDLPAVVRAAHADRLATRESTGRAGAARQAL